MSAPIIEVEHLTKEYQLGQLTGLGQSLRNGLKRLRGQSVVRREAFKALDDVSFTINHGEVIGIIGHNGAGKSTLLKTLAGISQPSQGKLRVNGRVAPLIEVGAGLVSEMTGRENIFLNGAILGMSRADIRRKFDEIVDFAEMEKFIDTPIKRYSSGMQIRLAFAIATAVESEVLIVDEVLAVGDLAFQRKCYDRIDSFVRSGDRTLLLVSHNLRQVERLCSRVILMNKGRLEMDDEPKVVCEAFMNQNNAKIASDRSAASKKIESSGEIVVQSVTVRGAQHDAGSGSVVSGDDIEIEVMFDVQKPLDDVSFTLGVHTTDMFFIAFASSDVALALPHLPLGPYTLRCRLAGLALSPGVFALHVAAEAGGRAAAPIFRADGIVTFQVLEQAGYRASASECFGAVRAQTAWRFAAVAGR